MSRGAHRVHVFGASGAGCTTLGASLAARWACPHADADDYLWMPTTPPFTTLRDRADRRARLERDLAPPHTAWVLSGSVCGWGDVVVPWITLAVFVTIPAPLRLARLRARATATFGARIAPGGSQHAQHEAFMAWAARYDDGDLTIRSRALHEAWIATLRCPVLGLDGDLTNEDRVARVEARLRG